MTSFNNFAGVFIDYRGFSAAYRADFTRFITDLATSFSQHGLRLGLVVPAEQGEDNSWESPAYDWQRLGAAVHVFQVRAPLHPLDYAPDSARSFEQLLRQVTSAVDRRKVLLTLSVRSLREVNGVSAPIGWHEAFAALGDVMLDADDISDTGTIEPGTVIRASLSGYGVRVGIDSDLQLLYLDYLDETDMAISRVWLTDAAALRIRLERKLPYAIAGMAFDDLLVSDHIANLPQIIRHYKAQQPANPPPNQLQARWSIDASDGPLDQVDANLDDDLVLTLEAPDGNYAVNWSIIAAGGVRSERQGRCLAALRAYTHTDAYAHAYAYASPGLRPRGKRGRQQLRQCPATGRQHQYRDWWSRLEHGQPTRNWGDAQRRHDLDEKAGALQLAGSDGY